MSDTTTEVTPSVLGRARVVFTVRSVAIRMYCRLGHAVTAWVSLVYVPLSGDAVYLADAALVLRLRNFLPRGRHWSSARLCL